MCDNYIPKLTDCESEYSMNHGMSVYLQYTVMSVLTDNNPETTASLHSDHS